MKWLVVVGFMYYSLSSGPENMKINPGELVMTALGLYVGVSVAWNAN